MSTSSDKVYYAVGRGRETGIYESWKECKTQTEGFNNAKYRKFYNLDEAKDFVTFWKTYSSPLKEESENNGSGDDNDKKTCEENRKEKGSALEKQPAGEEEETDLSSPDTPEGVQFLWPKTSGLDTTVATPPGGKPTKRDIVIALSLRLDSFEKRFDNCLKEIGGLAAEISHLRGDLKELKKTVKSFSTPASAQSPKKEKQQDGLRQTTLSFGPGSPEKSPTRFRGQKDSSSSGEPAAKRGRTLKRKLSRSHSLSEDAIENLLNTLKPETVSLSSFTVDANDFVEVYTDGSTLFNGREDAKAGIGVWFGDDHPLNVAEPVAGPATNITAEIQAARVAIQVAIRAGIKKLKIHTDSEFLINCATKWIHRWKRNGWRLQGGGPVKNRKELEILDNYASQITVQWEKVAAHSKIKGNETADRLANQGAARYER